MRRWDRQHHLKSGHYLWDRALRLKPRERARRGKVSVRSKAKCRANKFIGEFTIPADTKLGDMVYFDVKLPKNGLSGTSNQVAVVPPIKVTICPGVPRKRDAEIS